MGQPHTGPRCSIHRNEANTTTYNSNFPTQQSQKVTLQQHDLSILQVGSTTYNTNFPYQQPKSHHKTNTFCPVTQKPHQHQCAGCRRARLRCPRAAAGPGRTTSRRAEQSSRRGRRAGGPPPTGRLSSPGVIGHFVLLGLVPGVVVGGGVVEFVEADCVAPAGDDAGGLVGLAGVVPGIFEGCVGGHGRQDPRCWLRVS